MAWKEPYTTRSGRKRYRVVTRDASGAKRSKSFTLSKDADLYALELARREQLGHLWEDAPQTFGQFAGLHLAEGQRVRLTGEGWFERYRQTVEESTFDRRKDVLPHLSELVDKRIDKITSSLRCGRTS